LSKPTNRIQAAIFFKDNKFMWNIYIVGYMGSGKSSFGRQLAQQLQIACIDLDHQIEQEQGIPISKIFKQHSEDYFRNIERQALHQSFDLNHTIISTGGGTPTYKNNMELMNNEGVTIYLKADILTLFNRLKYRKAHRPILANLSDEELLEFIEQHLKPRKPFYEKAQLHLDASLPLPLLCVKVNAFLSKI